MGNYKNYFGFQKEPFNQDVRIKDLYPLPALLGLEKRFLYTVDLCAAMAITGDVGTGKSTSIRYAASKLHPSGYKLIDVTANTGTVLEILRQICLSLDIDCKSNSITTLTRLLRTAIQDIAARKIKPVLIIDEAHLMRVDVFSQLHLLTQFEFDSKPIVSLIFCGENNLLDKLMYHTSRPLASRIVGRSHLDELKLKEMEGYLKHHLEIAGVNQQLFSQEAILAIHQAAGGLLRRANHLARGGLIAATSEECTTISAEHIRIASTEII